MPAGSRSVCESYGACGDEGSPRGGDKARGLPTDGTLYEAELAHGSWCEPEKEAEHAIARRQALLAAGKLDPFTPAPVSDGES